MMWFLQADGNRQFYDSFDINQHPILRKGHVLLSHAIIAKASLRKFEEDFLSSVKEAAMEDENWMRRKEELETLTREEKELPKQWSISEGLLYYKDRLFIPDNEELQILIAKSCHDSKIAGHFVQEKMHGNYHARFVLEKDNRLGKRLCPILYHMPTSESPEACSL